MKRFMRLSLILFGAGLALVLYAVLFGPSKFERAMGDKEIPVGQIQYNQQEGSPQQPWLDNNPKVPTGGRTGDPAKR